jgi:DNA gyrase/topoisomerase IV subunit B
MVYVAETSLFYAYKDKQLVGGDTPEEVEVKLKKLGLKAPVHHCKGYGEVDAHVLRAMAFDPATRKLSRIIPTKGSNGAVEFQKLMSEGTEARKELLGI